MPNLSDLQKVVTLESLQSYLDNILTSVPDGTNDNPSISFTNDQASGISRNPITGSVQIVSGGNVVLSIGKNGIDGLTVPTAGLTQTISKKMSQIASISDFGVVNDPNQQNVAANTASYLTAIKTMNGIGSLLHPANMTVYVSMLEITNTLDLVLEGSLILANNQNTSVVDIQASNVTIRGKGIIDGNIRNQQGGVGTVLAGISANTGSTNVARPLPPESPITINNLIIDGITIQNVFNWPISIGYIVNSVVRNTTLKDSSGSPQFIFSAKNCWFNNNTVYNIQDGGFVFYQGNVHCGAIGNTIYGCHDGIGVYCDDGTLNANQFITITGNHVYNNNDSGIGVTTGGSNPPLQQQRISIVGNILHNNNVSGRNGGGSIGIVASQGVLVQGNLIFQDGYGTTTGNPSYSVFVDTVSSFITIQDNTIGDTGALSGTKTVNTSGPNPITTYQGQGTGIFLASPNNCSVIGNGFYNTQGTNGVMICGVGGGFGAACTYRDNYFMGAVAQGGFLDQVAKPADLSMAQRGFNGALNVSLGLELTSGNLTVDQGVICRSNFIGSTATGTTQATAQKFNQSVLVVTNGAQGSGVMPSNNVFGGGEIMVMNRTGNSILVYPPVGGQIEGLGVNVPVTLPNTYNLRLMTVTNTQYTGGQFFTEVTAPATQGFGTSTN